MDAGTGLRTMLARIGWVDPHVARNRRLSELCHDEWRPRLTPPVGR